MKKCSTSLRSSVSTLDVWSLFPLFQLLRSSCFGNATRLCVPRGASNRIIHAALAPHAAQFIKASLPGDAEPYKLKVSNAYGSVTVREIPCDDDVFRITENQCIAVSWTKEARSSMYFDDNQLTPLPLEASRASGEETTGNLTLYQWYLLNFWITHHTSVCCIITRQFVNISDSCYLFVDDHTC